MGTGRGRDERARSNPSDSRYPDFTDYDSITQQELYRGELASIRRWIVGTVLDVGSNVGRFSALSPLAVSVDIERSYLVRGIRHGNIRNAVVGSADALPIRSGRFHTVLAIGILEHVPGRRIGAVLDELCRVTQPGGLLIIRTTSPYSPFALLRIRLWSDYIHPYSPLRIRRELYRRGWRAMAWMSSGLLGVTKILPRTVPAPVLWARSAIQVFRVAAKRSSRADLPTTGLSGEV
jgi:SAM-dependent methyltransferase